MPQVAVRAAFYRGGTSRAVVFREADLAVYGARAQEAIILAALGSPDPYGREIDGLGGGISSLSKVAIVGPAPAGSGADVTYRFGQVDVEHPAVEFMGTCGNISAAIGPFAIDEGMLAPREPVTPVRVLAVNTGQYYVCHVPVRAGRAEVEGDYTIDGVPSPGARIRLEFLEPGGTLGRGLLPTGRTRETVELEDGRAVEVSIVDAGNPIVFLRAADLGATGSERPEEIDANRPLCETLDAVRDEAAVRVGLASSPAEARQRSKAIPKVVMVAPPASYETTGGSRVSRGDADVLARMLSMSRAHRTLAATAGFCTAVAASIDETLVGEIARPRLDPGRVLRIGHAAGVLEIGASVESGSEGWHVRSISTYRTARRIMDGQVYVPERYLSGEAWYQRVREAVAATG